MGRKGGGQEEEGVKASPFQTFVLVLVFSVKDKNDESEWKMKNCFSISLQVAKSKAHNLEDIVKGNYEKTKLTGPPITAKEFGPNETYEDFYNNNIEEAIHLQQNPSPSNVFREYTANYIQGVAYTDSTKPALKIQQF
ncbi:hypothetical protein J6590_047595 [Homalodisca vitripennis]|nr:hypothetical protein J6590_047595 [Homalodisca vitripennis]